MYPGMKFRQIILCNGDVKAVRVFYAFLASIKGGTNPFKDYLGGTFAYSGIAFEGIDSGYHLKDDQIKDIYQQLKNGFMPDEEASIKYRLQLKKKLDYLVHIFEKE